MHSKLHLLVLLLVISIKFSACNHGQCNTKEETKNDCESNGNDDTASAKYSEFGNTIYKQVKAALASHTPCDADDTDCSCYSSIIDQDLAKYNTSTGVTRQMLENAAKYGTSYNIYKNRLYRDENCMFPARCTGIEHFLLKLLPDLPNMDLVVNTRDWPQVNAAWNTKGPVFSFSKTKDYLDIMYPAWTFWAGGPAITLHPTGIGRWDLMRERLRTASKKQLWSKKLPIGFFRGSRTSDERDSLILLSRSQPNLVDAQYTKNQAWKSPKDTLNEPPAQEVSFEDHCKYKYLFNFRGVAASFRLKHLFLCKSLVVHVGDEWQEFFYGQLKPWVHYVPLKSYPSEQELKVMLDYFQKNDDFAEKIAERGYEFIWNHLRMQDIECYWRKLLKEYAKLLKYIVKQDDSLIEIK